MKKESVTITMTLQQIHYAITISETNSLNKAADILYVSQPSLTASMQELEKELGITIFYRSGKGMTLTNDGIEFITYARQVYHQYEALLDKYERSGSPIKKEMQTLFVHIEKSTQKL